MADQIPKLKARRAALEAAGYVRIPPLFVPPEHAKLILDVAELSHPEVKRICKEVAAKLKKPDP